jgi:hypothetical protein
MSAVLFTDRTGVKQDELGELTKECMKKSKVRAVVSMLRSML